MTTKFIPDYNIIYIPTSSLFINIATVSRSIKFDFTYRYCLIKKNINITFIGLVERRKKQIV